MSYRLHSMDDWEKLARQAQHKAATLAKLNAIPLRRLERHFEEKLERCPRAWLIGTRLRHATELLLQGRHQKTVAPDVGLKSTSNLCRFFRKNTGLSPAQYLEQLQRPQSNGEARASHGSSPVPAIWHADI